MESTIRLVERFFLLALLIFFLIPQVTLAQTQAGAGISPTLIERSAEPGDTIQTEVIISNLSDSEQTYYLFVKNISGVRDNGSPIYAPEGAEKTGYEMSEWAALGFEEITLASEADVVLPITINVPSDASPGSHFGGVIVSLEPPRLRRVGAGVGFEVTNIISLRIAGDILESAQIRSFATDRFIYGSPVVDFTARVENKGNVLVRPIGPLEVTNMFGERVANLVFNDALGGVFPRTVREFKYTWEDEGTAFGRYDARLTLAYGEPSSRKTVTAVTTFWVFPMNIIKPAAIALVVVLASAYGLLRLYINRKVRAMSRGRYVVRGRGRKSATPTLTLVLIVLLTVTAFFLLALLVLFA